MVGTWAKKSLIFEANIVQFMRPDHFLVSLIDQRDSIPIQCPFKFENMWLKDLMIINLIDKWWNEGPPMFRKHVYKYSKIF